MESKLRFDPVEKDKRRFLLYKSLKRWSFEYYFEQPGIIPNPPSYNPNDCWITGDWRRAYGSRLVQQSFPKKIEVVIAI